MKTTIAIALLTAVSGIPAFATTLPFPGTGDALFTITIPDDWKPQKDDGGTLNAFSPSEKVSLSVWELVGKEDAKNLDKDIVNMLKDHAKNVKPTGPPVVSQRDGMDGLLFQGTGEDIGDGHAISFFALMLGAKERAAVIFIEADGDAPEKESSMLKGILDSIKPSERKQLLQATLAVDKDSKPATEFTTEAPQLHAFFIGDALKAGDKIRGVWIAEDVGDVVPPDTKIGDATVVAVTPTDRNAFSLSRPANGWTVGKYRAEIYVNDELAASLSFTISKP